MKIIFIFMIGILFSGSILAQSSPKKGGEDSHKKYLERLWEGHRLFKEGRITEALEAYRRASNLEPNNPEPLFFVGVALKATGKFEEAEGTFLSALRVAKEKEPIYGRLLFNIAILLTDQKRWEEAKRAWQKYIDWGESHRDLDPYIINAKERQQAIIDREELYNSYEIVRERIRKGSPQTE